jgi:hypothetical protein
MQISDCRKITKVIKSFYDPDLGKFFTYFADISFDRKDIIFRNNDFIQFFINDTIFLNGLDSSIYSYLSIFFAQSKNFDYGNSHLSPIKLNNNNYSVGETNCFAYGWGAVEDHANRTTVLRKVRLSILNDTVCQITHNKTNQYQYDLEKRLCAANDELYKSVCRGDDGGPFVCPLKNNPSIWIQYGIASNNAGCDPDGGPPSLFTRVSHYIDWIEKTIRENSD